MSVDWIGILRYVRPAVLAATIVAWLLAIEPLFYGIAWLDAVDKFVIARIPLWWLLSVLHFSIAYLFVWLIEKGLGVGARLIGDFRTEGREKLAAEQREQQEKKAAEQHFLHKSKPFTDASPEEKLVLRVFVDNGYKSVSSGEGFSNFLRPLAVGFDSSSIATAISRLMARNVLYETSPDYFVSGTEFYLDSKTFAFLSEHPELVGSPAPKRHVIGS